MTGENAASLHDATSAVDHEDSLDLQSANKEIPKRTGLPSMKDLLIRKHLRWDRHLMMMSPDKLTKQVRYHQLSIVVKEREGAFVFGSRIPRTESGS